MHLHAEHEIAEESLTERVTRELPALRALAGRLTGGASDAEDLVQDVVERTLRKRDRIGADVPLRAWMFRVMHNLFIDQLRRQRPGRSEELDRLCTPAPEQEAEPWWMSLTADDVRGRIDELPVELRDAFRLFAFEGLGYREIAAQLGVAHNTVGTRILRARRRIRAMLANPDGTARSSDRAGARA